MTTIYYLFLLVITALGSSIMTHYAPAMLMRLKRLFTWKKRKPNVDIFDIIQCDMLSKRIDELEQQIHNVAETVSTRDRNRKHNIRRDVREYLEELKK